MQVYAIKWVLLLVIAVAAFALAGPIGLVVAAVILPLWLTRARPAAWIAALLVVVIGGAALMERGQTLRAEWVQAHR